MLNEEINNAHNLSTVLSFCVENICHSASRQEQADSSRGISLLSVLCFCQRRKSRLSQSRSLLRSPEGDHSDIHRVHKPGAEEGVGEYNGACAGPSDARGSVAIVPPRLSLICRRSTPSSTNYPHLSTRLRRICTDTDLTTRFPPRLTYSCSWSHRS